MGDHHGAPPPVLEAQSLTRTFDVSRPWLQRTLAREPRRTLQAIDTISFAIQPGTTLALVGESGCGKSTVARLAVGLYPPTAGTIRFEGHDLSAARANPTLRRRMNMIFQDPYASLNPRWRVQDIVAEPLRAFRIATTRRDIEARTAQLLTQVGLSPADGQKYPHQFSGGQRQRISIARALSSEPQFLVADEPTSALDVSVQAQILNLMRDLQQQRGLTYLFISHNLAVVRHMADQLGVMYLGRIVEQGPGRHHLPHPPPPLHTPPPRRDPRSWDDRPPPHRRRRRGPQPHHPPLRLHLPPPLPPRQRPLPHRGPTRNQRRRHPGRLPRHRGRPHLMTARHPIRHARPATKPKKCVMAGLDSATHGVPHEPAPPVEQARHPKSVANKTGIARTSQSTAPTEPPRPNRTAIGMTRPPTMPRTRHHRHPP